MNLFIRSFLPILKYLWEKTTFKESNSLKPLKINTVTHRPSLRKTQLCHLKDSLCCNLCPFTTEPFICHSFREALDGTRKLPHQSNCTSSLGFRCLLPHQGVPAFHIWCLKFALVGIIFIREELKKQK